VTVQRQEPGWPGCHAARYDEDGSMILHAKLPPEIRAVAFSL
jgi:hypothetical protein